MIQQIVLDELIILDSPFAIDRGIKYKMIININTMTLQILVILDETNESMELIVIVCSHYIQNGQHLTKLSQDYFNE